MAGRAISVWTKAVDQHAKSQMIKRSRTANKWTIKWDWEEQTECFQADDFGFETCCTSSPHFTTSRLGDKEFKAVHVNKKLIYIHLLFFFFGKAVIILHFHSTLNYSSVRART